MGSGLSRGRRWDGAGLATSVPPVWREKLQSLLPRDGSLCGQQPVGCAWLGEAVLALQPERGTQTRLSLSGKVLWVPSPLLRLHCDTDLNQSVPKKKEKYLALLLQPFQTSCPGSGFAKSPVPGSAGRSVSLVPAWGGAPGRTSRRTQACSGTMG